MQDDVRNKLVSYIKNNGIKMLHIAKETGIPDFTLCKFKYSKIDLNKDSLIKLDEYLRSKGA